eukprot:Hpha_TRINITY_DN15892_c0_g3::TRINITY_DN15892_c0_g3_i1::g.187268::m.187268/K07203/MTOR, FRAP, TOR; serine/threonine-protein kinase mTOR
MWPSKDGRLNLSSHSLGAQGPAVHPTAVWGSFSSDHGHNTPLQRAGVNASGGVPVVGSVADVMRNVVASAHLSAEESEPKINAVVMHLKALGREGAELPEPAVQYIHRETRSLVNGDSKSRTLGLRLVAELIDCDYCDYGIRVAIFHSLAQGALLHTDIESIELASQCIARMARDGQDRDGGLVTAHLVEEDIRRALERLSPTSPSPGSDTLTRRSTPSQHDRMDLGSNGPLVYAACSVLKQLGREVPALLHPHAEVFFDRIWNAIWSEHEILRTCAVSCLGAFLEIASESESLRDWTTIYSRIVRKVKEGFRQSECAVHGSLLSLKELLTYSKQLSLQLYMDLVQDCLDVGKSVETNLSLYAVSLEVLPLLARNYEEVFGASFLEETMDRIVSMHSMAPTREREVVYTATKQLCATLGDRFMAQHRGVMVSIIRDGLSTVELKLREGALQCLSVLCDTCPQEMEVELSDAGWQHMIAQRPLTAAHFDAVTVITRVIPTLRKDMLAAMRHVVDEALGSAADADSGALLEDGEPLTVLTALAEHKLAGQIDSTAARGLLLDRVLKLLDHDKREVRRRAVAAAGAMLQRLLVEHFGEPPVGPTEKAASSPTRSNTTQDQDLMRMLTHLVDLSVVDPDPSIRRDVLKILHDNPHFDGALQLNESVDCLFMAFHDADPHNRRLALICLCRACRGAAEPTEGLQAGLQRILGQLTEELLNSSLPVALQIENNQLLTLLIKHVPNVALPRSFEILESLTRVLGEAALRHSASIASLLELLAELNDLVEVDDTRSRELLTEFLPIIIGCFEDWRATKHSEEKLAAVHALIRIIRSAGLVIDFYEDHPHVLPVLLGYLQNKEDWNLQAAVMKLIGTIGAVDPLRAKNLSFWSDLDEQDFCGRMPGIQTPHHVGATGSMRQQRLLGSSQKFSSWEDLRKQAPRAKRTLQTEMMKASLRQQEQHVRRWNWGIDKSSEVPGILQLPMRSHPGVGEHYPAVALQALLAILSNPLLTQHHPKSIDAIRQVIKSLSQAQLETFAQYILVPILKLLRQPSQRDTHIKLFLLLVGLVETLGGSMRPHCDTVIPLLRDYWDVVLSDAVAHLQVQLPRRHPSTVPPHSTHAPTHSGDFPDPGDGPDMGEADTLASSAGSLLAEEVAGGRPGQHGHKDGLHEAKPALPVEKVVIHLISLVEAIGVVHDPERMKDHTAWILQNLLRSIQIDRTERLELTLKVFDAFRSLVVVMQDRLHILLPIILQPVVCGRNDVAGPLRVKSLTTLTSVLELVNVRDNTARVLHPLLSLIKAGDMTIGTNQILELALRAITALVRNTGKSFIRFINLTQGVMQEGNVKHEPLEKLLEMLASQGRLPIEPKRQVRAGPEGPKAPAKPQDDTARTYSCILSMGVESFSAEQFRRIIAVYLKINPRCIEILRVKGNACTVDFRFCDMDAASVVRSGQMFMQMSRITPGVPQQKNLGTDLRLVEVREKSASSFATINLQALKAAWSVRARGKRKARDWEEWLNRLSIELIRNCPSQPLRACCHVAQAHVPLARDLFSYVFVSCFQELDDSDKRECLANLDHALQGHNLPPFALHMILSLAEFMEEERYRNVYTTQAQAKVIKVTRDNPQAKFGIGYADVKHSNGGTWVSISRVAPKSAGERARVPENARVVKLNGVRVLNVKQVSELLADQLSITLELQMPNAVQRVISKPNPFFDIERLANVSMRKQLLAKALHYQEVRFREYVLDLRKATVPDGDAERSQFATGFIELCASLIHTNNNLGLRDAANGILEFTKRHIEETLDPERVNDETTQEPISRVAGRQFDSMLLLEGYGYEKLHWWSQAIKAYKAQAQEDRVRYHEYTAGILRCYRQLGKWEHLLEEARKVWGQFQSHNKETIAGLAAHAAWILSAWSTFSPLRESHTGNHWDFMSAAVSHMPREGEQAAERSFFEAILAVQKDQYSAAERHINQTRRLLENGLSALVGESYARSYNVIVWLQKVNMLEEVIEYHLGNDVKRTQLKEVWHKRMFGMQPTVEHWQDMLAIQALVLEPGADLDADDLSLWLKFVSICRRCNRNSFAESTLLTLMGLSARTTHKGQESEDADHPPSSSLIISAKELLDRNVVGHVALSYFKHMFHCEVREKACDELRKYVEEAMVLREEAERLSSSLSELKEIKARRDEKVRWDDRDASLDPLSKLRAGGPGQERQGGSSSGLSGLRRSASAERLDMSDAELLKKTMEVQRDLDDIDRRLTAMDLNDEDLVAKTHLTLGEWLQEIHKDNFWEAPHRTEILDYFEKAVKLTEQNSRAWHWWGLMNYRVAFRADELHDPDRDERPFTPEEHKGKKESHLVQALKGFFSSLDYLDDESFSVPNLLRVLTVWFRFGHQEKIALEIQRGIRSVRVSIWVYVLPQLVARVSFPRPQVRQQVFELLHLLGTEYPHHVVYPLTVCAVHGDTGGRRRCAQDILDRLSHGERGTIFQQAKVVSQGLIRVAISWAEYWFIGIEDAASKVKQEDTKTVEMKRILLALYGMMDEPATATDRLFLKVFQSDLEAARRYLIADKIGSAWERYKRIWERLQEWVAKQQELKLADVSPELAEIEGFQVAVPGVNNPGSAPVMIHRVHSVVKVIQSKQKPKIIVIVGDDGQEYKFLVKGHEDLRQDERVMQLFGLINALFQRSDDLCDLSILRYPVVPLSDNVGLIGWLERTETIYHMISTFRKKRQIPVNLECTFIMSLGQLRQLEQFYQLEHRQKHDLLSACLEKTPTDCLRRVFWTRTSTSEEWLEHRSNYVRTLAAMSMVGYILGLGDRHLNNMMLTEEGEVVHIDFGDCFEVALNRQRFPEQVPFRLTRLLVGAMEASGTEGTFRYTCERVMWCLRKNRDSLTSLLETFVYDPLINWRLLETVAPEEKEAAQEAAKNEVLATDSKDEGGETNELPEEITAAVEAHNIPTDAVSDDDRKEAGLEEMNVPDPGSESVEARRGLVGGEPAGGSPTAAVPSDEANGAMFAQQVLAKSATAYNNHASAVSKSVRFSGQPMTQCVCRGTGIMDGQACPVCRGPGREEKAIEGELVNEKAKQVVIRIREKLTGYDFVKKKEDDPPTPRLPRLVEGYQLGSSARDFMAHGTQGLRFGHSFEGSWAMQRKMYEDDEGAEPVSVAHRDTWWLTQKTDGDQPGNSEEPGQRIERCSVPEQVRQLIIEATSADNLCEMFIGWCPFW